MKKALALFIWFILFMVVWTTVGYCVSAPSDVALTLGLALGVLFALVSFKTRCFTTKWGK